MKEDILEITDVIKMMRDKGELSPAYDYYKPTVTINSDLVDAEQINLAEVEEIIKEIRGFKKEIWEKVIWDMLIEEELKKMKEK